QSREEREPKSRSGPGQRFHAKPESASRARQFPREAVTKGESGRCRIKESETPSRFSMHKRSGQLQLRCCQRERSGMEGTPSPSVSSFTMIVWAALPASVRPSLRHDFHFAFGGVVKNLHPVRGFRQFRQVFFRDQFVQVFRVTT